MVENYDKIFKKTLEGLTNRPRLLLHACCAPCSSSVLERLVPHFDVTLYFYNPNIDDDGEYDLRLKELIRFVTTVYGDVVKVIDGPRDTDLFYNLSRGREDLREGGERCFDCYALRLEKTAQTAKVGLYDYYCTTLSVSPYKNADKLNRLGVEIGDKVGVKYLVSDFKKGQGYVRSIELSKEYGLYRQNYCGCRFSRKKVQSEG